MSEPSHDKSENDLFHRNKDMEATPGIMTIRKNPVMLAAAFILSGMGAVLWMYHKAPTPWVTFVYVAVSWIGFYGESIRIENDRLQVGWSKIPRDSIHHIDLSAPNEITIQLNNGRNRNFRALHYHPKDWALFREKMEDWSV